MTPLPALPDHFSPLLALRRFLKPACLWLGLVLVFAPLVRAADDDADLVVVSSHASDDYVRTKLPDGSFQPESYVFGEGGVKSEGGRDPSIDNLNFSKVAHVIARPLANQHYLPARDPKQTKLLIMVYWGLTAGTSGASNSVAYQNAQAGQPISAVPPPPPPPPPGVSAGAMGSGPTPGQTSEMSSAMTLISIENMQRDRTNFRNAGILGYDEEMKKTEGLEITAMRWRRESLIEDLEDSRYFVVIMAYDFQLLWKEKKHKLVWETRFSIRGRGNEFDKQLEAMANSAAHYFGQDSGGLRRKELPAGKVKMDDIKILDDEPAK